MGASPLVVLAITVPTMAFQVMIVTAFGGGNEILEIASPTSFAVSDAVCSGDGFVDAIKCPFYWVIDLFLAIIRAVGWFLGLVTFDVPGVPWMVRAPIAAMTGGPMLWAIASMIRGRPE
jgi:hypothetical protein